MTKLIGDRLIDLARDIRAVRLEKGEVTLAAPSAAALEQVLSLAATRLAELELRLQLDPRYGEAIEPAQIQERYGANVVPFPAKTQATGGHAA